MLLPLAHDEKVPIGLAPAPRILVVEDMRDNRDFYAAILKQRGFAVNVAADGVSGLRMATLIVPDLILLNEMMPGLCGLQVLSHLRLSPRTTRIKVVMTSGFPMRDEAIAAGAVDFLSVPFSPRELNARIASALNG